MDKLTFILGCLLSAATVTGALAADIRIDRAASHAMVPGAKVGDGYLTIVNDGDQADRLISATSDRARSVQLHRMDMANGVMTMRELTGGLAIPPHTTVRLEPNYHLMFNNVETPFRKGETIKATLTFERAGAIEIGLAVGNIAGPLGDGEDAVSIPGVSEMHMPDMHRSDEDPQVAIRDMLKGMFELPERPLNVDPIVVEDDYALAGWQQDGRGGRVLLKKWPHGWRVEMLGGDAFKSPSGLESAGLAPRKAERLSRVLLDAERLLDADTLARFGSFEGTLGLSDDTSEAGHSAHEGHGQ